MSQNLSAQFVCPSPKVLDFNEKRFHWASIVGDIKNAPLSMILPDCENVMPGLEPTLPRSDTAIS